MLSRFEQFSTVISGLHRYIQKLEREEMEKLGYKGAFAQYLVAINRYEDGLTAAQLCEICDINKAAVSRAMAEMEEKNLIVRRSDNNRLYRAKVFLTDTGRQAAEFVHRRASSAVAAAGSALSDEERDVMYRSLDLIAARLQTLTKEGIPQQ